jgi:2-oxoglutarate ferredoxin oxidoreductase subunit gamma
LRKEIRFIGTGGQGVVWAATLLGAAVSKQTGLVASVSAKYGAEVRGGISRADIVISDEKEPFPWATRLDLLVVLDPRSISRAIMSSLKRKAMVLSVIALQDMPEAQVRVVPARERSKEELGSEKYTNSIMVGYVASILGVPNLESLRKAVAERSTEASKDFNLRAMEIGSQMAKAQ